MSIVVIATDTSASKRQVYETYITVNFAVKNTGIPRLLNMYIYILYMYVIGPKEKGDGREKKKNEGWKGFFKDKHDDSFCEGIGASCHRLAAASSGM